MKFFAAIIAYIAIGAVLGVGILKATHGSYWLLIASLIAYVVIFAKVGCFPPSKSH